MISRGQHRWMTRWESLDIMTDFVWILSSEKSLSFGNKGISSSYIIPKDDVPFEIKKLVGNRLWIVLRGNEDRLLKVIKIKKIEKILDGYHVGDFLISPEIAESFKLVSGYPEAVKYRILNVKEIGQGISELDISIAKTFDRLIKEKMQVKFNSPTESLFHQIDLNVLSNNNYQLARSALRAITSHLTLEQVWAGGAGKKLNAFSNFAYALLDKKIGDERKSDIVDELKNLDPISILFNPIKSPEGIYTSNSKSPHIDIEFTQIEPEKIYAREFLFLDSNLKSLEEALNKTEHAEKIHQDMLQDISMFLINQGIIPYESGSIDLIYSAANKLNIFEIKSTNLNNILAQASKGAFQVACYLNALCKNYSNLNARLILHKIENNELEEYVIKALSRLNITVLFYDPSKPWPNRIEYMPL